MKFTEEQLDLSESRITEIEKTICVMQDSMTELSEHIRETQRYLIKLAHHQSEITKRISAWPFIAVDSNRDET
jgi:uncharacterized coiled-coil protein SlyX|tara:strand:- start:1415 stop:1633 length:219 start_codon:yes stop_codon:yes gene_type:complete